MISRKLLDDVVTIAHDAGAAIMVVYSGDIAVAEKDDRSPLTEADERANAVIVGRLREITPDLPILSEEAVADFPGSDAGGRYWLVDPLDGTKEFIKRNGEFTVNIALIENGKPVLGVVYAPALGTTYLAAWGLGAFKQAADGPQQGIGAATHGDGDPWRVVGSRSHAGDSLGAFLQVLGDHELVSMGSSLKLCLVAEGAADLYPRLGPTSLWDTAAAQCVVEQAGGEVLAPDGRPLSYANPSERLNPHFLVHGRGKTDWRGWAAF
ncbi:3'(2'),5'-bisphosphate nucleotidase CysQ [Sulfurisoma sediminicola]|uniref:3'(2'),5'-bisphosphate nucleotidase CysQ n=1 Tax=Sulfurisoma sediminicola TaxID=1381557 RepID=A0A497XJQ7_9PROT|nr:3'(2'),5'-bisphosphate nucleotidase CysQ [Sulfurisoma sediminicola]RLJ67615.1 3'(2'),5'-bisphosphate nucleotidase [Sulfurisoma sediminicola]